MAKKIFFGNYKGGVGKTTSAFYLAKQFAEQPDAKIGIKKVLIIDLDPQCSMSEICARSNNTNLPLSEIPGHQTLNYMIDMLHKNKKYYTTINFDNKNIVRHCNQLSAGVDFIPTSLYYRENCFDERSEIIGLDGLMEKIQTNLDENILLLHEAISSFESEYDYIFFDCPPSNNILTKSAFLCSDYFIIPYISDNISIKGVQHYISTVKMIYSTYCEKHADANFYRLVFGNEPILLGIFECMRIRNENPRGNLGEINCKRYSTVIKNLIKIQEALSRGDTGDEFGFYKSLAAEILKDLEG